MERSTRRGGWENPEIENWFADYVKAVAERLSDRVRYDDRFGLIYIDCRTQERTIKDSGYWYKHVIETNGEEL